MKHFILVAIVVAHSWLAAQSPAKSKNEEGDKKNTLSKLFQQAITQDSVEVYTNDAPSTWLFFKSSYSLEKKKNAIVGSWSDNSTLQVQLYLLQEKNWRQVSEVQISGYIDYDVQSSNPLELYNYDYNFDGQRDLYVRIHSANGPDLMKGRLFVIDPVSHTFIEHPEATELYSIWPDPKNKTVLSYELSSIKNGELCTLINKWVNGKLKTIRKEEWREN